MKLGGEEAMRRSKELYKRAEALQSLLSLGGVQGKEAKDMEVRKRKIRCEDKTDR